MAWNLKSRSFLGPQDFTPQEIRYLLKLAADLKTAQTAGARILLTEDVHQGVTECDVIYADVWAERIKQLMPYQVNADQMAMTGNPPLKTMHCQPAFHITETDVGAHIRDTFGLDDMEVPEDLFEGAASIVFDQAENRMHAIKAVLVATLGS